MTRAAVVQLNTGNEIEINLSRIESLLQRAASQGAQLVLLPENTIFIGIKDRDKIAAAEKLGKGVVQDKLAAFAERLNLYVIAGSLPIQSSDPNKVFASCIVWDNQGKQISCYQKIHLFDVALDKPPGNYKESDTLMPGKELQTVETPIGKIGLSICYDLRFPELYRQYAKQGCEVFVVPAAFTAYTGQAHWQVLLRARAIENGCFVLAANQTGTHPNLMTSYGHSQIIDPWGEILCELAQESDIAVAEIDLQRIQEVRKQVPGLLAAKLLR